MSSNAFGTVIRIFGIFLGVFLFWFFINKFFLYTYYNIV
jgi:hypothetical protein